MMTLQGWPVTREAFARHLDPIQGYQTTDERYLGFAQFDF